MPIYTIYIEDDRYSVPTLLTAELDNDVRAEAYASDLLSRSQHYLAIDVWEDDRKVARVALDGAESGAAE